MKKIILIVILITIISYNNSLATGLEGNVAVIDLTPPLEMKFALGGYGERMSKPAEGVNDRIWAKAIVFKDSTKKYAIVTIDILAIPPNVKPGLIKSLSSSGWSEENIMLLPSHSHTSLDMSALNDKNNLNSPQIGLYHPQLLKHVMACLIKVICEADKEYKKIQIGTGRIIIEGMNRNRRGNSYIDNNLTVTRIDYENGNPLAAIVNWTAHPTFLSEKDMLVSGGWPGFLQTELERLIGYGAVALFYNGAEGDQSPIGRKTENNYKTAENYGRELANRAISVYESIETNSDIEFNYSFSKVELPDRQVHPSFMETGGAEYNLTPEVLDIVLNVMSPESTIIGAVQIGDLVIVGAPGELTAGLGLVIKNKMTEMGIKYPTIGGLANEWISYILSEDEYDQGGGYEASVSFYGPQLGKTIVEGMIGISYSLLNTKN